jgi:hypothetical protein
MRQAAKGLVLGGQLFVGAGQSRLCAAAAGQLPLQFLARAALLQELQQHAEKWQWSSGAAWR